LCGKINSVLCYFCERDALIKLKLLQSYCSDFYGSVLWDLSHASVEDICIAWRRGLRRVWGLPPHTHSALVAPLCGLLQLKVELACRCAGFITKCLCSANQTVRSIATHGVYSQRMRSPVGRNAKRIAWIRAEAQLSDTDYDKLKVISELLCVQHH